MRTVIIDDEAKGRITLNNFIRKYAPGLNIVGEADSVESGVKLIDDTKPDLVFLDVQLPDGTGFDVLGMVSFNDFQLIFCTAFDQYAIKAFRFSAIDYILKPIDPDVFISAVNKLQHFQGEHLNKQLEVLMGNRNEMLRMALHSADGIHLVNVKDIVRCESSGNYTTFHFKNAPELLVSKTLKEFDDMLASHRFLRIHKSHLINLDQITTYLKGEGGWVKMSDGSTVEVSRRRKDELLSVLSNI